MNIEYIFDNLDTLINYLNMGVDMGFYSERETEEIDSALVEIKKELRKIDI